MKHEQTQAAKSVLDKFKPMELPSLPDNPLVSVLIANYNYGMYIGEAIESVLNQTYQNFEIIICDDGSTDNSLEVVEHWAKLDKRVKYIAKENGGVASALNACYSLSEGQIICFLDADDIFVRNKIAVVVESFHKNLGGFLIHPVQQISEAKEFLGIYPIFSSLPNGWIANVLLDAGGVIEFPPVSGLSLRKEVAELIFPLNTAFRTNADGIIQRIAPLVTEVISLQDALALRRVHSQNITYVKRITPQVIEREIEIGRRLWDEQRRFLLTYREPCAELLKPYETSFSFVANTYLLQRLNREPKEFWLPTWRQVINHIEYRQLTFIRRFIWYLSRFIGNGIFPTFLNLWMGHNRLKAIISRCKKR